MSDQLDAYQFDRYSRQIGAYGVEAMSKLIKMKVLVSGLRGVGVEAAKNLALAGPGAITLHDDQIIKARDLGVNFFATESDIGTATRSEVCVKPLGELNRLVRVSVHRGELTDEVIKAHTVVVLSCASRTEALRVNDLCRKHGVAMIFADVYGCMGFCFVDLGDKFTVRDFNGEQPVRRIVTDLTQEEEAVLTLVSEPSGRRHNMEESEHDGWVRLEEFQGALGEALNGKVFKIKHVQRERTDAKTGKVIKRFDAFALRLNVDTTKLPPYSGGGTMTQVKKPVHMPFRTLRDNLQQPVSPGEYGLMFTDGTKFGRAEQLHMALQGLWEFEVSNGRLPVPNDAADAEQVAELAAAHNASMQKHNAALAEADTARQALALDELERDVAVRVGVHADCELQPLCAFFGGVVAQEVVKVTGKFAPLNQWLHFDAFEVLPEVVPAKERGMAVDAGEGKEAAENERFLLPTLSPVLPSAKDRTPMDSRYDDLIMMLGRPLQERVANMNTFVVGCGALGCELLKNFAMVGLSTGDKRKDSCITVTDNDRIEVSNLSRQFLFREHNVGQAKSTAAAAAAVGMNPDMRVRALESFVGPNTEDTFDDQFWEGLDFVTNALDNVTARLYVDSRCVFFDKPLLESGTLGTKCNVQVILPHLTQSYADGPEDDGNADSIPMCTLRNFPSSIEHCIEWARAQFTDLFETAATEASNYIQDPRAWIKALRAKTVDIQHEGLRSSAIANELKPVQEVLEILRKVQINQETCFADCVRIAHLQFHRSFRDKIVSLIKQYPEDDLDESGKPFWSGTKRFPRVVEFDASNPMHMLYVISMANLLAVNFGLQPPEVAVPDEHPWRSPKHVGAIIQTLEVPEVVEEKVDLSEDTAAAKEDEEGKEDDEGKAAATEEVDVEAVLSTFNGALKELEELAASASGLVVEPADFEKDADWNFHIDFITAACNMRAWNYKLKEASRHEAKMIAGKIIPAIATTTAAVTGLVMIEMLKIAQGKPLEAYKDSSSSLGINGYFCSEPSEPVHEKDGYDPIEMEEVKCRPAGFTKWDKTLVRAGNVTLGEFLAAFKEQVGLNCVSLYHENANVEGSQGHSKFIYEREAWQDKLKQVYEARKQLKLRDVVQEIYGDSAIGDKRQYVSLLASSDNDEGQLFKIPAVVFRW